jgi:beta-glucosidase
MSFCCRCSTVVVLLVGILSSSAQEPAYKNQSLSPQERAHDLVGRMTIEEKAQQLEDWAPAIPRLGVPDYQSWGEALHGVARAGYATVFPQAIGMAATWDPATVKTMGEVISREARAKFNQAQREGNHRINFGLAFFAPNINIFRDPRWGRGQETYGEDPFLAGRMGIAYVNGVQGSDPDHLRAVATSKHFAVHSGPESIRHGFNVDPTPRDLEETYLPAFRATVTEGNVQSVMCAYNSIDAYPACTNKMLLESHLRRAWGFNGFVISDCGAIVDVYSGHKKAPNIEYASAMSLLAGTDISCSMWAPGFNTLAQAVRDGLVTEADVTVATERLYAARFKLGLFNHRGSNSLDEIPLAEVASSANRAEALKAAEKSIVLLKNDGTLPLKQKIRSVAVVGPTADLLTSILGNYQAAPPKPVTPLEGLLSDKGLNIHYAQGSSLADGFAIPVPRTAFGIEKGLKAEFYSTPDWTGIPLAVVTQPAVQSNWENAAPMPEINSVNYSVRWSGTITAPAAGDYVFSITSGETFPYSPQETYRLTIDGKVLGEGSLHRRSDMQDSGNSKAVTGASPTAPPLMDSLLSPSVPFPFCDTEPHAFIFEYSHAGDRAGGGVTLKWIAPAQAQLDEALTEVKKAEVIVAFVGLSPNLEGEEMNLKIDGFFGGDRTSIDLPAPQQKLLEALAETGKPVVVVLQSGSAIALNWAKEHAAAVLAAWYPGMEGGTAIARTLVGLNNPSGRLPITFYRSTKELPEFSDYSMKNRTYRYFTGSPLWGFGYGLSYTNFKYGPVKLSTGLLQAGDPISLSVAVENTGSVTGDEVVEAYLKTPQPDGPRHSLVAFEHVSLAPGESQTVILKIDPRSISSVDDRGVRSILAGKYALIVGGAQPEETTSKSETGFVVEGDLVLPQ